MAAMETLSEAVRRLTDAGYERHLYPVDGHLVCGRCGAQFDPSTLSVDEIVRFEGASDPDDQAILFALDAGRGHRGLYSSAYGAATSTDDVDVLVALPNRSDDRYGWRPSTHRRR